MARGFVRAAALVATAFAVVGCGGDDETFALGASSSCLSGLGDTSESLLDSIAEDASGGAVRLEYGGRKEVMVVFGEDSGEAADIEESYDLFGGETRREGNVVMAWTDDPDGDESDAVADCLA